MKKENLVVRTTKTIEEDMRNKTIIDKVCDVLEAPLFKIIVALTTIVLTYGWLTNWTFEIAIQTAR